MLSTQREGVRTEKLTCTFMEEVHLDCQADWYNFSCGRIWAECGQSLKVFFREDLGRAMFWGANQVVMSTCVWWGRTTKGCEWEKGHPESIRCPADGKAVLNRGSQSVCKGWTKCERFPQAGIAGEEFLIVRMADRERRENQNSCGLQPTFWQGQGGLGRKYTDQALAADSPSLEVWSDTYWL